MHRNEQLGQTIRAVQAERRPRPHNVGKRVARVSWLAGHLMLAARQEWQVLAAVAVAAAVVGEVGTDTSKKIQLVLKYGHQKGK